LFGEFQSGVERIKIEGDDQTAAWMRVEVQGGWDDLRLTSSAAAPDSARRS
jgi:hypothetical protein